MARSQDPNSAGSQFFICVADAGFLDRQYTAFGRIAAGDGASVATLDKIANARERVRALRREKRKEQVRAFVEHPFRIVKCVFGYRKVRFKGLMKNTAQVMTLFALANLYMARRLLMPSAGKLRPQLG